MNARLIRIGLSLAGNAIGLLIAATLLDQMTIDGVAFVLAVVIFTVLAAIIDPIIDRIAERNLPALRGGSALLTTFLALVVTAAISSGLSISGANTWIIATVLVWALTVIAGLILAKFLIKEPRST